MNENQKRMRQTEIEIVAAYPEQAKRLQRQGDITFVEAEFWVDKNETLFDGLIFQIPKGHLFVKKWVESQGLEVCKKSEAASLLVVGEQKDGLFIIGACKNYWLKPLKGAW